MNSLQQITTDRSPLDRQSMLIAVFFGLFISSFLQASITFDFGREVVYKYSLDDKNNILTLEFNGVKADELSALDTYDEDVIRRVVTSNGKNGKTVVKLFLRDPKTRVVLNDFNDPFRIIVDFFSPESNQLRDQITGYPLSTENEKAVEKPASELGSSTSTRLEFVTPPAETSAKAEQEPKKTRLLLQARPEILDTPEDLKRSILELKPGIGPAWSTYPPFVFRFQAPLEKYSSDTLPEMAADTFTATQAMGDYASRLFDFGHENRALLAFQQVIYRDPDLIKKNPEYLWRLAETHLGQGNLTLAMGYYQLLEETHRGGNHAALAKIRLMDIDAIREQAGDSPSNQKDRLSQLPAPSKEDEISIQVAIRKAYWGASQEKGEEAKVGKNELPEPPIALALQLDTLAQKLPKQRSTFIAAALALSGFLSSNQRWAAEHAQMAVRFFENYKGPSTEPYRSMLLEKYRSRVRESLSQLSDKDQSIDLVSTFEALPKELESFSKDQDILWRLAEAYRSVGQTDKAVVFYSRSAKAALSPEERFRSLLWYSKLITQKRNDARESGKAENSAKLGESVRSADKSMMENWEKLGEEQKNALMKVHHSDFEDILDGDNFLATPPRILLESVSKPKTEGDPSEQASSLLVDLNPAGKTILLKKLSDKFLKLGLKNEAREAQSLLKELRPKDMADDFEAKNIWAEEMAKLADELRQESKYLDAGRLYAMGGAESENWPRQAESLYKGGLLLYRAGRREEALNAFKRCSEDGQNRYYANLCLERLDRLEE